MSHNVLAVANRFLQLADQRGVPLTPMHLQKLCYFAQGYSLAFLEESLIADKVEAWDYGPVFPALYDAVKRYGSSAVPELIRERNWASADSIRGSVVQEEFSDEEDQLIESIFDTYGAYEAFQLSALTHEDDSPWSKSYVRAQNARIPNKLIKEFFLELADAPAALPR